MISLHPNVPWPLASGSVECWVICELEVAVFEKPFDSVRARPAGCENFANESGNAITMVGFEDFMADVHEDSFLLCEHGVRDGERADSGEAVPNSGHNFALQHFSRLAKVYDTKKMFRTHVLVLSEGLNDSMPRDPPSVVGHELSCSLEKDYESNSGSSQSFDSREPSLEFLLQDVFIVLARAAVSESNVTRGVAEKTARVVLVDQPAGWASVCGVKEGGRWFGRW